MSKDVRKDITNVEVLKYLFCGKKNTFYAKIIKKSAFLIRRSL